MGYNTAPFHGKVVKIRKNTTDISYSCDWSINAKVDMADISSLGDAWKTALPGLASWDGSMKFHFVAGNTEQKALMDNIITAAPGTKLTDIKFVLDAQANQFTGNIYLTSIAIKGDLGAIVDVDFNFQGDGALTLTSSGT
jgi:hypothetical protein